MATYDDYDGVYFTIQSLRLHHNLPENTEFVVIDNNPTGKHSTLLKKFVERIKGTYVPYSDVSSSFTKYKIVDYAKGDYILIVDCHVLFTQNSITNLISYYKDNPNSNDLLQGVLLLDELKTLYTHFDTKWRGGMYGTWGFNNELYKLGKPFEIPMQGMGMLSFRKDVWKGINKNFVGFGGEEGYIAEKFRSWGGTNLCLPDVKWVHRFGRPNGVPFRCKYEDRVWNYYIGWMELYKNPNHPMIQSIGEHFKEKLKINVISDIKTKALSNKNLWS
jgi:hypothetical protein